MPRLVKNGLPPGDHLYDGRWWRHFASGQRQPLEDFVCGFCKEPSRGPKGRTEYCSRRCTARARALRGDFKGAPAADVGSTYARTDGYIFVAIRESDPLWEMVNQRTSRRVGWVQQHRLVMARHLGRPLYKWESVHHINGDRADNRIENLQLRVGPHGSGQLARCADCGSNHIVYDPLA